jgi:hypothetical protein
MITNTNIYNRRTKFLHCPHMCSLITGPCWFGGGIEEFRAGLLACLLVDLCDQLSLSLSFRVRLFPSFSATRRRGCWAALRRRQS